MGVLFMTGFPGFIASRLLQKFLKETVFDKYYLLVEEKMYERALRLVGERDNVVILIGDIRAEKLGIEDKKYEELLHEVSHIMHLAAIYNLRVKWGPAYDVNVTGTKNVTDFVRKLKAPELYLYFSTAYVSGLRGGIVFEDELIGGYGFKNNYEHTKFLAEKHVRQFIDELPLIIVRPGIVIGDSKTGETSKFDGPYFVMRFFKNIWGSFPLPYIGRGEAEVNLVPIDYIVDATYVLILDKGAVSKTFHLVDPKPKKARELYRLFHKLIRGCEPVGSIPVCVVDFLLRIRPLVRMLGVPREALPYFTHNVHYDNYNTEKHIEKKDIKVPRIDDYADVIVAYFLEHYKDPEKFIF